jgi:4-deoxy-L-threo-5-hexosulose-uronate ketol-isomerase
MTLTETRNAVDPDAAREFGTAELREHFHLGGLFAPEQIKLVYSQYDRMVLGSCVPGAQPLTLDKMEETGTPSFLDQRELAVLNIGPSGNIDVGGSVHPIQKGEVLYVGRGSGPVTMAGGRFYLVSAPAHQSHPTRLIRLSDAKLLHLRDRQLARERVIMHFVHPDICESCQLAMGYTKLSPGSVWNTLPANLHTRRMKACLYFDLPLDQRVFHLMGPPEETRHIVVANEEAVLSPPWSIHAGVGTAPYSCCWATAGETVEFTDMDEVAMEDLR